MPESRSERVQGFAVVKIYTKTLAIVGKIRVSRPVDGPGSLDAFLNREDVQFVAVQDATVLSTRDKKPLAKKTQILLNKSHIAWIIPIKEPEYRS